ncbi:MAG TPA: NAD(P)/FAD-dependent oxidoreductase [Burkholderiales bacterium]|jgi:L-2-hydroxyglutarate oxidase LhgO|nr:NAD(P)/FAD-dependent oxidoreductase [Burkholderiales bacterium]
MTERVDCAVIGAGIVGLAVARELALLGREVIVIEAADAIGTHTSSRNSEVIHAGLYYGKGSLKARFCSAGKRLLYTYCREHGVPHRNIGKIVVAASDDEIEALKGYVAKAEANGVTDLRWLSRAQLRELEPHVECVAGFLSPSTGIVDSHALMLAYQGDAQNHRAAVVLRSPVRSGEVGGDGIVLNVGGDEPMTIACNVVVNSAGLFAQDVARSIRGIPEQSIPPRYFAKAHYYTLSGKSPFRRLVYPVATNAYLGVHVTVDLAGQVRFGPDVSWVDKVDYSFDESREPLFYRAIRKYYPALKDGQLQPGYTGIRPKVSGEGAPAADFVIQGPKDHGVPGLVNLYGIESPGLTASMAIAQHVCTLLQD